MTKKYVLKLTADDRDSLAQAIGEAIAAAVAATEARRTAEELSFAPGEEGRVVAYQQAADRKVRAVWEQLYPVMVVDMEQEG